MFTYSSSCWLSHENGFIWSFAGPVLLVILVTIFVIIIIIIFKYYYHYIFFIRPSIYSSIHLSIHLFIHPSIHLIVGHLVFTWHPTFLNKKEIQLMSYSVSVQHIGSKFSIWNNVRTSQTQWSRSKTTSLVSPCDLYIYSWIFNLFDFNELLSIRFLPSWKVQLQRSFMCPS